jgi:hypothetical protein
VKRPSVRFSVKLLVQRGIIAARMSKSHDGDTLELPMKVVGRRRWGSGLAASAGLLELALRLRGDKPFLPRGVYRFRSFEESDEWILKMMTRPRRPGRRF